jgi:transposase
MLIYYYLPQGLLKCCICHFISNRDYCAACNIRLKAQCLLFGISDLDRGCGYMDRKRRDTVVLEEVEEDFDEV